MMNILKKYSGLLFFYLVCCLIAAICLQAGGMMKEGNPIAMIGSGF